ncbi:extracellular solute-binding protein [Paenibacillus cymbidii]|uniref:extracellular solute-binding protein n=1 Tax=Paenibacillus cymbidii TaxID=1639034 RepID=UPI0010810FB4|nr:extracellular solute-binding protein [Paenibacillus cymbidii]
MNGRHRGLTIVLLFALAAALAGCGASRDDGTNVAAAPRTTISMLLGENQNWPYRADWPVWKMIEQATGVSLAIKSQPDVLNYSGVLNATIASGNMPDLLWINSVTMANMYGQQGALANILDYAETMPNLRKWLARYPDIKQRYLSADDKMYLFPNQGYGETNRISWMYREDVFREHGLAVPATYDELYETAKQLKRLYPDSYPILSPNDSYVPFSAVNFGTYDDMYYDEKKAEWRYGPIEDNFYKLLQFWHRCYAEGLIPPDWMTIKSKQFGQMIAGNKVFVTLYYPVMDYYNIPLRKDNPAFTLLFMPPPAGLPGGAQVNPNLHYVEYGMSAAVNSPHLAAVMKYMDFFYSEEGRRLSSWGVEGVTYKVDNGKKSFIGGYQEVADMINKTGLGTHGTYTWIDFDAHMSLMAKEAQDAYREARKYDSPLQPRPAFNVNEMDVFTTVGQEIDKLKLANIRKFISGERSLGEWDQFVEEVRNLGLERLERIYRDAYARSLQAKP